MTPAVMEEVKRIIDDSEVRLPANVSPGVLPPSSRGAGAGWACRFHTPSRVRHPWVVTSCREAAPTYRRTETDMKLSSATDIENLR